MLSRLCIGAGIAVIKIIGEKNLAITKSQWCSRKRNLTSVINRVAGLTLRSEYCVHNICDEMGCVLIAVR